VKRIGWLGLALGLACAPPPTVQFGPPAQPPKVERYHQVRARWTRHIHMTHEFDTAMDATATVMAPEMRAAYQAKLLALQPMSDEQRTRFEDDQRLLARDFVEVFVEVEAGRWEWNDFTSTRSLWRMVLSDDQGRRATPADVQQAPLKPEMAAELFPPVTPFTRTWRVRFARWPDGTPDATRAGDVAIGGAATRRLVLRITGPLGDSGEALAWETAR
jgi:hypothetical protein